mmetsp:Transcript_38391/g.97523  ORF Transcript_38391/g.97523 Transcript_38391/m.97523 type:complete len:215 (-) Transcript_38391:9-653(-)
MRARILCERVQHGRGIARHHVRRVGQQHVEARRRQRRRGDVLLRIDTLHVPAEARAVPRGDVGRAIDGGHLRSREVRLRLGIERVDDRVGQAEALDRTVPVLGELAEIEVGDAHVDEPVVALHGLRGNDERRILRRRGVGTVRRRLQKVGRKPKFVRVIRVRDRRIALARPAGSCAIAAKSAVQRRKVRGSRNAGDRPDREHRGQRTHCAGGVK